MDILIWSTVIFIGLGAAAWALIAFFMRVDAVASTPATPVYGEFDAEYARKRAVAEAYIRNEHHHTSSRLLTTQYMGSLAPGGSIIVERVPSIVIDDDPTLSYVPPPPLGLDFPDYQPQVQTEPSFNGYGGGDSAGGGASSNWEASASEPVSMPDSCVVDTTSSFDNCTSPSYDSPSFDSPSFDS